METKPTVTPRDAQEDATELIQIMGQSLNMALLYGVAHKVTRSSLEISFTVISKFIEFHEHIHFSVADGALLINGESTSDSPLATSFATRLTGLNLFSFTIGAGFSMDECVSLFSLLLTPPSKLDPTKTAAELMEGLGLKHIETKSFSYRRVSEDEPETPTAEASPEPAAIETASAQPDLDNIMAFLKEDALADPTRSAEDIRHLAADTEKLAELILRAVEIRSSMANLAEGESLTDLIVGCIQKVVQPILKDPDAKTQKGRKHIKHSLLMLEKALLERLRSLAGDQAAHATEAIMDDLVEELDMDAIASKYMKSRRLAEKDSQKISRLIDRAADDPAQLEELRDRLVDQGLTPAGWQELTVKLAPPPSGPGPGGTGAGGATSDGVNEIKVLTLLLARIGETIHHPPATGASAAVQTLISETGQHLSALADITDKKIQTLQTLLTDEERNPVLPRKELIEILAEIAQEIMQPLTIITGTTAMLRSLRAGPLSDAQGELLSMIAESGERMIILVSHLMDLAGTPESKQPDQAILDAAYQKSPPS
ncbi:MAG: histidine kinase dimerization/phospho-acceptor domain-containing protein [bacterium]